MGDDKTSSIPDVSDREERFLNRLSRKYEKSDSAGRIRSYVIASVIITVLFAISRWIAWWGIALVTVETVGLTLFHQYKRFANSQSRLLTKLWNILREGSN